MNKYKYIRVLQWFNGTEWEDIEEFEAKSDCSASWETAKEIKRLREEYFIAFNGGSFRSVDRRVKNEIS
jgi:hypothetical protein